MSNTKKKKKQRKEEKHNKVKTLLNRRGYKDI